MRISPQTFEGVMLSSLLVAAMLATVLIAAFPTIPSWGFVSPMPFSRPGCWRC